MLSYVAFSLLWFLLRHYFFYVFKMSHFFSLLMEMDPWSRWENEEFEL